MALDRRLRVASDVRRVSGGPAPAPRHHYVAATARQALLPALLLPALLLLRTRTRYAVLATQRRPPHHRAHRGRVLRAPLLALHGPLRALSHPVPMPASLR